MTIFALLLILVTSCRSAHHTEFSHQVNPAKDGTVLSVRPVEKSDRIAIQASTDPLGLLRSSVSHYDATIHDYRCRFLMRVSKNGRLGEQQDIAVKFRENPYSVDMDWIRNPDGASRVTYVAGRWREGGKERAMIYPAGVLGAFTPLGVKLDIHSPLVMKDRDHGIDEFGFRQTLMQIIQTCDRLKSDPAYSLNLQGVATLENRSCYVLRRLRSFPDPLDPDAERMLVIYLDREWLVPIGCFEYADDHGTQLMSSFITADVDFNVGLTDADF